MDCSSRWQPCRGVSLLNSSSSLAIPFLVQGPLPPITEPNGKLQFLALHENQLSGFISESLTNLREILHLDLSINSFTSTIPEKLAELTNLRYLHLAVNNFAQGTVPKFLIELTNLRELGLKKTNLQGTIPEYIQYLSNLQFLDFRKCPLWVQNLLWS